MGFRVLVPRLAPGTVHQKWTPVDFILGLGKAELRSGVTATNPPVSWQMHCNQLLCSDDVPG
jgi:hypothetical protein